jgi:hypothetical protein
VIKNCADPVWTGVELTLGKLCMGNLSSPIVVELFDWNAHSAHDFIGQASDGCMSYD